MKSIITGSQRRDFVENEYDVKDMGYGRYKPDDGYFVDTYEEDKKRQNQNYSNLLGQKLGDKEGMENFQDPVEYSKNTLEMNVSQREEIPNNQPEAPFLPSVHYSEFKNSKYYNDQPKMKSNLQMMEERTQRMRAELQNSPPAPSQQTISEPAQSVEGRNFYRQAMGYGVNPINNTENRDIFGKKMDEHQGDIVVRDYKVQGYKYKLMKQTDKEIQAEFLKNGYHIINLKIDRDPISGNANGSISFRARLMANQERLFEHFMKTSMNYVVMAKK